MAKTLRVYSGTDTYGRDLELAQRIDGVWFYREWYYNGYGYKWSKWSMYNEVVNHPTQFHSSIEGHEQEVITLSEEEQQKYVCWGFNYLKICSSDYRVRLPKY